MAARALLLEVQQRRSFWPSLARLSVSSRIRSSQTRRAQFDVEIPTSKCNGSAMPYDYACRTVPAHVIGSHCSLCQQQDSDTIICSHWTGKLEPEIMYWLFFRSEEHTSELQSHSFISYA